MTMPDRPVLIAYDGSERAQTGHRRGGPTARRRGGSCPLCGARAAVDAATAGTDGVPDAALMDEPERTDADLEAGARTVAEEGVTAGERAGLRAVARKSVTDAGSSRPGAIAAAADELDARLIVTGSHGHSALRSALLGSVSSGVISRTTRPVLVVPEADWRGSPRRVG